MTDEFHLNSYDNTPVFTIKTVVQETGIPPATLRAWERRYGVLSPGRSEGGYRLYSERDIAVLRWLKRQVDSGVSISRAVALRGLRHPGDADETQPMSSTARLPEGARSPQAIGDDLLAALMAFEESRADALLGEAFALYPVEMVAEEVMIPVLVEVGERWHHDEATVVQEHFATAVLRRRLTAMFHAYDQSANGRLAITGAAPAEWHDIGILLVSLALRRNGWRVIYLGQNVPAGQLLQEIRRLQPDLVCLSATARASAEDLAQVYEGVAQLPAPRPRLVFGGRAFDLAPELRDQFAGAYIGASARDLIAALK